MNFTLYHNNSPDNYMTKNLTRIGSIVGTFLEPFNIEEPTLLLSKNIDGLDFNYLYCSEVQRSYFMKTKPVYLDGIWQVDLKEDYLSTWKDELLNMGAIISRQEKAFNTYLRDDRLPIQEKRDVVTIEFPQGFLPERQNILVLATCSGGSGTGEVNNE